MSIAVILLYGGLKIGMPLIRPSRFDVPTSLMTIDILSLLVTSVVPLEVVPGQDQVFVITWVAGDEQPAECAKSNKSAKSE